MIWYLIIGLMALSWSLCAIASWADHRMATMRRERAERLYRVATGAATDQDYADTTLYEMDHITYALDFTTFCERNRLRV